MQLAHQNIPVIITFNSHGASGGAYTNIRGATVTALQPKDNSRFDGQRSYFNVHNSEVCHPRCAFKLYGEMNSVKKHNYKIWLNDGVY